MDITTELQKIYDVEISWLWPREDGGFARIRLTWLAPVPFRPRYRF